MNKIYTGREVGKLENIYNDIEYINIISNILKNEKFLNIKKCRHHGITRFEHSLRVSYYSYLISKKLKLNYNEVARGGLLHDFFITSELEEKEKKVKLFIHPYKALENATNYFNLTDLERDIIVNHMFPVLPHKVPKYLESWIVSLVDKTVAIYEFYCSYARTFLYKFSKVYMILLLCRFQ